MTTTTTQTRPERRRERVAEHETEYVFATVNGRYEAHVIRRGTGAWVVRLGGFALHRDGCFWTATDGAEPAYPLDEAIARTLRVLARLP